MTDISSWRESQFKMGQRLKVRCFDLDQERRRRRLNRLKKVGLIFGSFVLLVGLVGGVFLSQTDRLNLLMSTTSFVARLVNPVELKESGGRVNALILGLDMRENCGLLNTDTILVASFSLTEGDPVLISIPRDLWVTYDKAQMKINTPFSRGVLQSGAEVCKDGSITAAAAEAGVAASRETIEKVLGIPIHYWTVVNFEGFEQVVDTLGGIRVCVERTFDDYQYPVPGMESAKRLRNRYEHLHFDKGCQKMDGETALKYSRSRMGTNGEGSDFARARRQQKVIVAVKEKVLSLSLLFDPGKVVSLYKKFTKTVKTNTSLAEAQRALEILYDFQDLDKIKTLVLDPKSGLTYVPQNRIMYGGAYVIVPKGDDFGRIHKAVRKELFGSASQKAENGSDKKSKTE